MIVTFYFNNNKPNVLNKELTDGVEFEGSLTTSFSYVDAPTIVLRGWGDREFNYCYIKEFNRYYFINGVNMLNNNKVELNLNCDYLMSFRDVILNSKALATVSDNPNRFSSNRSITVNTTPYIYEYDFPDWPFSAEPNIVLITQK